jgi:hypothetical protein
MKKSTVFALILLAISVPSAQAQLFPRLIIPGLPAVGDPAPAPQPAPQTMDRKAAQKAEAERQAALKRAQNPNAETGATGPLPQIDPATGLPIDPNAPAAASTAPTIDPATGLPVLANGTAPAPATEAPAKPRLSPRKRVKKLFGR